MSITYSMDDQLRNTVVLRFNNGWNWRHHYEILKDIGRACIATDERVDYILDFSEVWTFPPLSAPAHIRQARDPDMGFPRNGGISVYCGSSIYARALIISVGVNVNTDLGYETLVPNVSHARTIISMHRMHRSQASN